MKKILVTGGEGSFASSMKKLFKKKDNEVFYLGRKDLDITNKKNIEKIFKNISPDAVIHAAALTRPMFEHENNPCKSIETNIIGTANIAIACQKNNIKMIYLSTDHVYQGIDGNYKENSPLLPVNKYAWSKLGGECSVMMLNDFCILRMAAVQKPFPHKKALVDSYKSSIFIDEIAKVLHMFIDKKGIYNIGSERMSIYDFAKIENSDVGKIFLNDIENVSMPTDSSLNLRKMKEVLEND